MIINSLLFVFVDRQLLMKGTKSNLQANHQYSLRDIAQLPEEFEEFKHQTQELIVSSNHGKHYLLDLHHLDINESAWHAVSLRELLSSMQWRDFQYVAQAWQYALFLRTHRYCGRCGEQMRKITWEMAMHCDKCGHRVYPRVSPCIIVSIYQDNKILLAQGPRQVSAGYYSTLAGFVESAESLEQALHREVMEEVGIKVQDLEYFDSQAWPFPHSLMVGYIAKYKEGQIKVDGKEIIDAQFFEIDKLPAFPPTLSIAGRLIEETIKRIKTNEQD